MPACKYGQGGGHWLTLWLLFLRRAYVCARAAADKGGRDLSLVECGQTFYLEVQALDRFNNRQAPGGVGVSAAANGAHASHKRQASAR